MNKINCPDFDAFQGQSMVVPFIFRDGHVGSLEGKCRGFGAICADGKKHEETIGVYNTDGDYLNIRVDLRVTCAIPTFMIGETAFHYPVVACLTMGCKVDPVTGVIVGPVV
jgi:hypothetical protein